MDARQFSEWADDNNLSISDRRDLLREVRTRGENVDDLEPEDLTEIAEAIGLLYGAVGRAWRWIRGLFG